MALSGFGFSNFTTSGSSAGSRPGKPKPRPTLGSSNILTDPRTGNEIVDPSFSELIPEFLPIDFGAALEAAQDVGQGNANIFFDNITRARDAALGLVDTDVLGIQKAFAALSPTYRAAGEEDLNTNIGRAGKIDKANFARIPSFNRFNQGQVSEVNAFNRGERLKSIEASGVDYRDRITQVLDDLAVQEKGGLSSKFLDKLATTTARDRGADIASASGISPLSGEGRNIQDMMDFDKRLGLVMDAQKTIPQVAGQAQSILQPPEQQLPTILAQPTQIPLNASNAADKIPLTSNVSAGAAQQALGTQATNVQVIPPAAVLGQNLGAQQFNATGMFNADVVQQDIEQSQLTATDAAAQSLLNENKADEIREQQFEAFQQNLAAQQSAANTSAITSLLGGFGGALLSSPKGSAGNSIVNGIINGGKNLLGLAQSGVGAVIDAASAGADAIFGDGDGKITVGNTNIDSGAFNDLISSVGDFFSGNDKPKAPVVVSAQGLSPQDSFDVSNQLTPTQQFSADLNTQFPGERVSNESSGGGLSETWRKMASGFEDTGLDARTVAQGASTISNWGKLTPVQQITSAGQMGLSVLENKGIVSPQESQMIGNAATAISVLSNPKATAAQRATSLGILTSSAAEQSGAISTLSGANANSAIQAFGILTNPQASTEQKLTALASIGIRSGVANNIISQVAGGNINAGLAILNTAANWNQMNPAQKAVNVMQTASSVYGAMSEVSAGSSAAASGSGTGSSILGFSGPAAAPGTAGGAFLPSLGIAAGAYTGAQQIQGFAHLLEGDTVSMQEHIAMFPLTGGFDLLAKPFQGTFGGGKDSGQEARDSWRKGLGEAGLAVKKDGSYYVSLADGTNYNIGLDGGAKLKNVDGGERNSFDIDWKNKVAVNSIADAHLFAIASGIDPTSAKKFDTFHRAVAQSVNAATSNTNDINGVRENFKTMMSNVDPRQLAMRIETLRQTNNISEQEYGVYLSHMNQIFGTNIMPTDRQKAQNSIIQGLQRKKSLSAGERQLLSILNDQRALQSRAQQLQARMERNA